MIELPLSKDELQKLKKQEKHMKIIVEELRTIMDNHQKSIIQYKKKLQVKDAAEKVISALHSKVYGSVTGDDMFRLIKLIESDNLFKNIQIVNKCI